MVREWGAWPAKPRAGQGSTEWAQATDDLETGGLSDGNCARRAEHAERNADGESLHAPTQIVTRFGANLYQRNPFHIRYRPQRQDAVCRGQVAGWGCTCLGRFECPRGPLRHRSKVTDRWLVNLQQVQAHTSILSASVSESDTTAREETHSAIPVPIDLGSRVSGLEFRVLGFRV